MAKDEPAKPSILVCDSSATKPLIWSAEVMRGYCKQQFMKRNPGTIFTLYEDTQFPVYQVKVQQPQNGDDCGVFLLMLANIFLENSWMDCKLDRINLFDPNVAKELRVGPCNLISHLSINQAGRRDWQTFNPQK